MKLIRIVLALACAVSAFADAAPGLIVPPMVTVPAGVFTMGSEAPSIGDGSHNPGEGPPHVVRVPAFRMARYETTVGQFRQFIAATGHKTQDKCWEWTRGDRIAHKNVAWDAAPHAPTDYHPVMCVTWEDANAYVRWLAQQTGRLFRLPSEAEWEYAARAGTTTDYPTTLPPTALCAVANIKDRRFKDAALRDFGLDVLVTDCDDGAAYTTVVGMYPANGFGLHDVMGNVAEWVSDCQHPDYQGAPVDGSAWNTNCQQEGDFFITRGGSYSFSRQVLRSAARGHGGRNNASSLGEGFRIAEDLGSCTGVQCAYGSAAFQNGLGAAQQLERQRREQAPMLSNTSSERPSM
jgi:formylglycine-generating enzyme required for sulfatase activity